MNKKKFGSFIAAGVIVFLLNILGLDISLDDVQKPDTGKGTIGYQKEQTPFTGEDVMHVHFLDVEQGLSILVQLGDEVLIYDGGERDMSSFIVSYLSDLGITEIDYLISSHYDSDHVSGLIGCLHSFDVKNVIGSDYVHDSNLYTSFMTAVEEEGLEVQHPSVGTRYSLGEAEFTILSPKEIVSDSNSNSVAIKLTYGESDFIFTGDADHRSEKAMIASGIDLDCEVLSVGHHGSATATSEDFLLQTLPEYAVISCGEGNSYGHPHEEVMDLLEAMNVDLFRSDKQGTVVAATDGEKITWSSEACNDYRDGDASK